MAAKYKITEDGDYLFDNENDDLSISLKATDFAGDISGETEFKNKFSIKAQSFTGDLSAGNQADSLTISASQYIGSVLAGDGDDKVNLKLKDNSDIKLDLGAGNDSFSYKGGIGNNLDLDTGDAGLKKIKLSLNDSYFSSQMGAASHNLNIKSLNSNLDLNSDGDGDHLIKLGLKASDADIQLGAGNHNVNAKLDNSIFDFSSVDQGADVESSYLLKVSANNNSEFNSGDLDDGNVTGQGKASKNSDINFSAGAGDHQLKLQASSDSNVSYTQIRGDEGQLTNLNVKLSKNSHAEIIQTSDAQLLLNASIKEGQLDVDSGSAGDQINLKGKGLILDADTGAGNDFINLNGTASGSVDGGAGQDTILLKGSLDLRGQSLENLEVIEFSSKKSLVYLDEDSLQSDVNFVGSGKIELSGSGWSREVDSNGKAVFANDGKKLHVESAEYVNISQTNLFVDRSSGSDSIEVKGEVDLQELIDAGIQDLGVLQVQSGTILDLNQQMLNELNPESKSLRIEGDQGTVTLNGAGWVRESVENGYATYSNGESQVVVPVTFILNRPDGQLPSDLVLSNVISSLDENTDTSAPIKLADIEVVDDGIGSNNISLSGIGAEYFEVTENALYLKNGIDLDFEIQNSFDFSIDVDDPAGGSDVDLSQVFSLSINDVDEAPTGININYVFDAIDENTDTSSRIKVADLELIDDAVSDEIVKLRYESKQGFFEVIDNVLYIKAGTDLDYEATGFGRLFGGVSDLDENVTKHFSFAVNDVDEGPTALTLENTLTFLDENSDTSSRIKVADIAISGDPDGGENTVSLSGVDASSFEVDGTELFLKSGLSLDYEVKDTYAVNVSVDGTALNESFTLNINDLDEAPTALVLENTLTSIDENTDTSSRIKVADIAITDDALGTNLISLSGADASSFEVNGTELFLKPGVNLDFESQTSYDVSVSVSGTELSEDFSLDVNDLLEITIHRDDFVITDAIFQQSDALATALDNGNFVVIWRSNHGEQRGSLYDSAGDIITGKEDFIISNKSQPGSSVTALEGGGFAVVWAANDYDYSTGSDYNVYGSLYDSSGDIISGKEALVISNEEGHQYSTSIVTLEGGGYVVVWQTFENDSSDIHGALYDSSGNVVPGKGNFVISNAKGDQSFPAVTALESGDFAVTWRTFENDSYDIHGALYDSSGDVLSDKENFVISNAINVQSESSIVALKGGGFITVWETSENGSRDIHGSIYDGSGNIIPGKENFVISNRGTYQEYPSITALEGGGFVVIWETSENGSRDIHATMYDSSGDVLSDKENFVISNAKDHQFRPSVTATKDGGFAITWQTYENDSGDIHGALYDSFGNLVVNPLPEMTFPTLYDTRSQDGYFEKISGVITGGDPNYSFSFDGLTGDYGSLDLKTNGRFTFNPDVEAINALNAGGYTQTFEIIVNDGQDTHDYSLSFDIIGQNESGFFISEKGDYLEFPSITSLDGGGFVVVWDTGNGRGIRASLYDSSGRVVIEKENFIISSGSTHSDPSVTSLKGGGFAVAWQTAYGARILGSLFDNSGNVISDKQEFIISDANDNQFAPSITSLEDGSFVVIWETDDYGSYLEGDIYASMYDSTGNVIASKENFIVSNADGQQYNSSITALEGGGFIATWFNDENIYNSSLEIRASLYHNDGSIVSGREDFAITDDKGYKSIPSITALEGGGFVVILWESDGLHSTIYDEFGNVISGDEAFLISEDGNSINSPSITALAGGGFAVTWENYENGIHDIRASLFDSFGNVIFGKENFIVSDLIGEAYRPLITTLDDGGFIITWNSTGNGSYDGIHAKRFDNNGNEIFWSEVSGTAHTDVFNGQDNSNDRFVDLGTGDEANGGDGNDTFYVASNDFASIDGGASNSDVLVLESGVNLGMSELANVTGIELIDLKKGNGTNSIDLNLSSIQDLQQVRNADDDHNSGITYNASTSDLLRISGDINDMVSADGFSDSGADVRVNGVNYDLYRHDLHTDGAFLLEQGVLFA